MELSLCLCPEQGLSIYAVPCYFQVPNLVSIFQHTMLHSCSRIHWYAV